MRTVTKETITGAFLDYCSAETDPRLRFVLEKLVTHLHDFAREVELTHDEWNKGIELLTRAGEITDVERNEFVLMSDVLGLSSLVDMINSSGATTPSSLLGPFHISGAPELPVGGDLKKDNAGDTVIVQGKVTNRDGEPLAGANIEIWQTADNGLYSNQDADQPDFNLRTRLLVGDDGHYAFTTIRPVPYTVPSDGPVGDLLRATGRHPWRPSHLHFIIMAENYRTLVTEVFPDNDPYLDEDPVFGVREGLVTRYRRHEDIAEAPGGLAAGAHLTVPFFIVDFDFVLAPA